MTHCMLPCYCNSWLNKSLRVFHAVLLRTGPPGAPGLPADGNGTIGQPGLPGSPGRIG